MDSLVRAKFRVKVRSLMDEARTIRAEERKACAAGEYGACNELHLHRVGIVRSEARATFLAYAYCRGVPYRVVEGKAGKEVDRRRVLGICKSLAGVVVSPAQVSEWEAGVGPAYMSPVVLAQ